MSLLNFYALLPFMSAENKSTSQEENLWCREKIQSTQASEKQRAEWENEEDESGLITKSRTSDRSGILQRN